MADRLFGGASPRTIPSTRTPTDEIGPGVIIDPGDGPVSRLHATAVSISAALQKPTPLSRSLIMLELPSDTCEVEGT